MKQFLDRYLIQWIPFIFPIVILNYFDLKTEKELFLTRWASIAWILSLLQCIIISAILYLKFGQNGLVYAVFWLMSIWYLAGGNDNMGIIQFVFSLFLYALGLISIVIVYFFGIIFEVFCKVWEWLVKDTIFE